MDAYVRRFCEVKTPRDVLQFLEAFVYVWPWALAGLFALYRLGADYLPRSLVLAAAGLAVAEAGRLHSSTISPYATDYHLLEALKVVAITIGVVVVAGPSAVVLSDCVDALLLSWSPSFLAGQALAAKLGLCSGSLLYLLRCYVADAAHEPARRARPPAGAVPRLDMSRAAAGGAGEAGHHAAAKPGALARLAGLKLRARAALAYLHEVRHTVSHRRRGGDLGEAFFSTFLVADVAPIVVAAFLTLRSLGAVYDEWLGGAGVAIATGGDAAGLPQFVD